MAKLGSSEWKEKIGASQRARFAANPELKSVGNKAVIAAALARRIAKTCPTCGFAFDVSPGGRRGRKRFCSTKCFWEKERPLRAANRKIRGERKCSHCNLAFLLKPGRPARFCSIVCRAKWQASLPWDEWRGKLSGNRANRARGDRNGMWGVSPPHGRWVSYERSDGSIVRLRSTWEAVAARYLDACGIAWAYEPKRFKLLDRTYTPDFWLPEIGVYWEVKGWMHARHQETIRQFRVCNPSTPLIVLGAGSMRGIAARAGASLVF